MRGETIQIPRDGALPSSIPSPTGKLGSFSRDPETAVSASIGNTGVSISKQDPSDYQPSCLQSKVRRTTTSGISNPAHGPSRVSHRPTKCRHVFSGSSVFPNPEMFPSARSVYPFGLPPQAPAQDPTTFPPPGAQSQDQPPYTFRSQFKFSDGPSLSTDESQVPRDAPQNTMDNYVPRDLDGRVPQSSPVTQGPTGPVHNWVSHGPASPLEGLASQPPPMIQVSPKLVSFPQQSPFQSPPPGIQTNVPNPPWKQQQWAEPTYRVPNFDTLAAHPPPQFEPSLRGRSATQGSIQRRMSTPENSGGPISTDSGYASNYGVTPQFPRSDEPEDLIPKKTRDVVLREYHSLWDRKKNPPMQ